MGRRTAIARSKKRVASPAGLEPATPGFIPLRLSPPRSPRVRGLDYPFTLGPSEAFRCRPSSLYTFPGSVRDLGLARDRQGAAAPEAFPEFERIRRAVSHRGAQLWSLGNLCSVQLSYGDVGKGLASSHGTANRSDPNRSRAPELPDRAFAAGKRSSACRGVERQTRKDGRCSSEEARPCRLASLAHAWSHSACDPRDSPGDNPRL